MVIIYTRPDGGVAVCRPMANVIRWMSCGGRRGDLPRGYLEAQIDRQAADGFDPGTVRRFFHAMHFGGCTTAEAYEIIRDRDCAPHGTAHELMSFADLPDQWFRNAWRRGHNGGPIGIDMTAARKIQLRRIKSAATKHKADLELPRWRERIRRASSPEHLRQIWPRGLKTHG